MGHKPDKNGVIRYSQWVPGASDSGPNDEPRSYWERMLREERQKQVQRPKQPSELQNAMNRPITQVWTAYNLANESMDAMKARFPHKTMWNDEADAYRHFRWNYAWHRRLAKRLLTGSQPAMKPLINSLSPNATWIYVIIDWAVPWRWTPGSNISVLTKQRSWRFGGGGYVKSNDRHARAGDFAHRSVADGLQRHFSQIGDAS